MMSLCMLIRYFGFFLFAQCIKCIIAFINEFLYFVFEDLLAK